MRNKIVLFFKTGLLYIALDAMKLADSPVSAFCLLSTEIKDIHQYQPKLIFKFIKIDEYKIDYKQYKREC